MQIKRTIKGHEFSVQLRAVERAETLGHAEPAYNAHVTICRDGRDIGSGRWDARGFLVAPHVLANIDDSERALRVLTVAIREHLAALPVETRADEATTSMQRVTFAPGLRGDELRRMAGRARLAPASLPPIRPFQAERRAWDALADALDAAAERDEAGNAPEAP
jgi:hypothetical protein